jgi:hypothetical protein
MGQSRRAGSACHGPPVQFLIYELFRAVDIGIGQAFEPQVADIPGFELGHNRVTYSQNFSGSDGGYVRVAF